MSERNFEPGGPAKVPEVAGQRMGTVSVLIDQAERLERKASGLRALASVIKRHEEDGFGPGSPAESALWELAVRI